MRSIIALSLVSTAAVFSSVVPAQSQRHSSSRTSYSAKTAAEVKAGSAQIASEIKVLSHFLYLFGGVTKDIQVATASADGGSATVIQQNEHSKARVIQSITDVRKGLQQLETSFGSSPVLKAYYPNLAGVGDIGVAAEKSAQSARYDQCGKSLLQAVDKLTDALAAMK